MLVVGKSKIKDKQDKKRLLKYSDVPTDNEGWVRDLEYRPIPFDIMQLAIKDAFRPKPGWWDGYLWEGPRLQKSDEVTAWKRQLYTDYG